MEEVICKDTDGQAINHHLHHPSTDSANPVDHRHYHHHRYRHHDVSLLDFLSTSPTRPKNTNPLQIPLTALSLSLGPSYNYTEPSSTVNNNDSTVDGKLTTSVGILAALTPSCKKRSYVRTSESETIDQRRIRLIKNRESSSRSREKKQAYMESLEKELASLQKENAELRSLDKLSQTIPADIPEKHKLRRTLTAPF